MAKRIYIDGVPHRMRRGKLVVIPAEWVGRTSNARALRKRREDARDKAIAAGIIRAKDTDALRHEENPYPDNSKRPGLQLFPSRRKDKYRNKWKRGARRTRRHTGLEELFDEDGGS